MIKRELASELKSAAKQLPVVAVLCAADISRDKTTRHHAGVIIADRFVFGP